jgi:hypothetical protein
MKTFQSEGPHGILKVVTNLQKRVLTEPQVLVPTATTPVEQHGNHDKSEADGARTRNHRIDSPVL